jgi:hypothetical protein
VRARPTIPIWTQTPKTPPSDETSHAKRCTKMVSFIAEVLPYMKAGSSSRRLSTALTTLLFSCPENSREDITVVFGQQHRVSAVARRGVSREHLSKHTELCRYGGRRKAPPRASFLFVTTPFMKAGSSSRRLSTHLRGTDCSAPWWMCCEHCVSRLVVLM